MKQLARFYSLGHYVIEVEPRHLLVADFRIDTNHLRAIESRNEPQHGACSRQIDIPTWLIRFRFERETIVVALIDRVFAKEVQSFAIPLQCFARIFRGIYFSAFPSTPENVNMRTQFGAEVHRPHRLLQRVQPHLWIARSKSSILKNRVVEEI